MNVLIVDDDRFVVASLVGGIDWSSLGFEHVYKAYNINKAKTIIAEEEVHLLISDIDMPNGTGLDLLTWIRECHNDMPVIFLTNYADFNYAQRALELKSFHYFLKPIEFDKLTEIIQNATQHLTHLQTQAGQNCEYFWQEFLRLAGPVADQKTESMLDRYQVHYALQDSFLPVIFDLSPYYLTQTNTLKNRFAQGSTPMDYMKTTFGAVFTELRHSTDVFLEYNQNASQYLAVFRLDAPRISPNLLMACENLIGLVSSQIHCSVNCFVGIPADFGSFHTSFSNLTSMMTNKLDCRGQVLLLSEYTPPAGDFVPFDGTLPEVYLENRQYQAFLEYCHQYLKKLSIGGSLHSLSLTSFQIDVVQIIYTFLKSKGILANKLFHDDSYHTLSNIARKSIRDMELYLQYMLKTIELYLESSLSETSIAHSMKEYADQHYTEDISRSILSDIFYMDSDYASKLFKKEFGISFKNYVINKRIEAAKDLLSNTSLPVNIVSANVGYENYSYFTRLFRKVTGMTPVEYRGQGGETGESYENS